MPAGKPSSYLASLRRDGFVVVRNIVTPQQLNDLRAASKQVEALARSGEWPHVRTVGKQFPPWQFNPEKGIWGVQHLLSPDLPGHEIFTELYFSEQILSIVRDLLSCTDDELVLEVFNMLVRPESQFDLRWHRDDIPADATAEKEMERLERPSFHAQYNFALYDDDSLVLVPGSHARARTETERNADPFAAELPNQLAVELRAGDIAFYNNNILHRGVYNHTKERVTLHGSVGHVGGNRLRATNVLQHGFSRWIGDLDFSRLGEGERERAEGMRDRLVKLGSETGEVGFSLQG